MPQELKLVGKKFNRWQVLWKVKINRPGSFWICRCECGEFRICSGHSLKSGVSKSCGCLQREKVKDSKTTHGESKIKIYSVWTTMKRRCRSSEDPHCKRYGLRGITVCDEWKNDFMAFYNWAMANGYREGLQIDRINNDGNYEPNNCRWVTAKEQANNRSTNKFLEYRGERHTISQWSRITGIARSTLVWRISKYGICDKIFSNINNTFSDYAIGLCRKQSEKQRSMSDSKL